MFSSPDFVGRLSVSRHTSWAKDADAALEKLTSGDYERGYLDVKTNKKAVLSVCEDLLQERFDKAPAAYAKAWKKA